MADAVYRSISGTVEFDPETRTAGDKEIRSILIQSFGVKDNAIKVSATLWPEFDHIEVKKGDVVAARGKFEVKKVGATDDRPARTFFNLSVNGFAVIASLDSGKESDKTASDAPADDAAEDDDIPY